MAGGIDWFRWHHGSVTDPKFQLVARKAGARLSDVLAIWAYVLEHASAADVRGEFGDLDTEAIDCLFGFEDGLTASVLEQMGVRGLVCDGEVLSWTKRQPKREREDDSSTNRVKAFRERASQQAPSNANENQAEPCNATKHQETPRVEERREEKYTQPNGCVAPQSAATTPADPKPKRSASGTRLPQDWFLPDTWGQWGLQKYPHFSVEIIRDEALKFANHWRSKTGKDATKHDWYATWQNWLMSDICQKAHPPESGGGETNYQRSMRERVEQAAGSLAHIVAAKAPGSRPPQTPTPWEVAIENNARTTAIGMD